MRVVLQRVSRASVTVAGRITGSIERGFLLLVGFAAGDGEAQIRWMVEKIIGLRVFPDDEDRMNRDIVDVGGALLVVPQFTLYADVRKGRRPSFVYAAQPDEARSNYENFVSELIHRGVPVETGEFGTHMDVELLNDGPVTLLLDR